MLVSLNDYSAAVFDLDGTLLNTLRDISEAANRSLQRHGYPSHPANAFCAFIGDGPDVLFQRATQAGKDSSPCITELVETYREECIRQQDRYTTLYPGLTEFMPHLQTAGLQLTILTNKRQLHAERCVERFLDRWEWQVVLGSGDHIPRKPDPAGALKIASDLNTAPEKCLYFGDTDVDMWTAKRAGMTAVGVLWGFRNQQELESAGADVIIRHPKDLIEQEG
ncbi:MAG: HAD family hydrolase [Verrucomicrobiota bacterium]